MFLLGKLLWLLAQPLSLTFLLGLFGLIVSLTRFRRIGFAATTLGLLILFVTLYTTAGTVALQSLEARFPKPGHDPQAVSCMIVLGGAFSSDINTARKGYEMNEAADRYVEALRLALKFPGAKILVSGGDGSFNGDYDGDAVTARRFFTAFGLAPERLVLDKTSRNTEENIENSKSLLEKNNLQDCLLITSAFHMPRAMGLMRQQDISVLPWPTDYRTTGKTRLGLDFTQPTLNARNTATALREWLGLLAYRVAGRISTVFPAPEPAGTVGTSTS
ncbi:YdcF family protein [Allorhizobium sp. BGMRC 0089]|uniref:YdcF family protein n=1 Tax=Allorhizobium sonneratiae TaxID=2934936 RepID=UPI0020332F08|nr:YdcF family protein [Allorhizobium sonneratiae]MCM2291724.1 YdcF family protein [Allorhizobium sonneratiae]